jgi:hypothetical protein
MPCFDRGELSCFVTGDMECGVWGRKGFKRGGVVFAC